MRTALLVLGTALMLAGCTEKKTFSVVDFLENEAVLYGTLTRCDEDPAGMDPRECANARQAAERIAAIEERTMRAAREQAFENARAEYRQQLEQERELRIRAEEEAEAARLEALTTSSEGPADAGTANGDAGGTMDEQAPADVAPPEADEQPAEDPPG